MVQCMPADSKHKTGDWYSKAMEPLQGLQGVELPEEMLSML